MSAATLAPPPDVQTEVAPKSRRRRFRRLPGHLFRLAIGVFLCTFPITAVLALGWIVRLMRRRALHGWWRRSPRRDEVEFAEFAAEQGPAVPRVATPRWLVAEDFSARLDRPDRRGRSPGRLRKLVRLPRALLGGVLANLQTGLTAIACTAVLTLPGSLFLLGGWEYGWNISFYKGYEQAFIGRSVAFAGALMLAASLLYIPMATAHLAASGDARAFFQFRLVGRLIRERLGTLTVFAAAFAIASVPATFLWIFVQFFPNAFPWLIDATPEQLSAFADRYRLIAAGYLFPMSILLHLAVVRIYRGAVLAALRRDPGLSNSLPASIRRPLDELGLLPDAPLRRRHPLVAVVIGTGRRGTRAVLWVASFLIWFLIPFQMLVAQFVLAHPFVVWLNPPLILLPGIFGLPI